MMRVSELRNAILRMSELSKRHGAIDEAEALRHLAELTERHDEKSVKQLVELASRQVGRGRRNH